MAKLVLVRHGQSQWNLENRFTGWVDVPITELGEKEAKNAGEKIKGIKFQQAFTSALIRAQQTLDIILDVINQKDIPVEKDQALNERHYGDLQGLNKAETAKKFGDEQVHIWRRSYDVPPPNGESLKDTAARTIPYFQEKIMPVVKSGKNVLVSAHGNSLRSIVMDLDKLSKEQVLKLNLGTGVPIVYDMDKDGKILKKEELTQLIRRV
jgi:2,3-bisphosphoglycerate-dependent phosphoglycerate mutase